MSRPNLRFWLHSTQGFGVRPGLVFVGEVLDDLVLKLRRFVNQVIRNAQLVADRAGIRDRLRPAALVLGARHAVLRPQLERDAHHVVALFEQQRGGSGGIHSAAHANYNACFLLRSHKPVKSSQGLFLRLAFVRRLRGAGFAALRRALAGGAAGAAIRASPGSVG